jgi:putative endonuclease
MTNEIKLGPKGEEVAVNYLTINNYLIIDRNWRFRHWEIDIVARHNSYIVFVEVKTQSSHNPIDPRDLIGKKKQGFLINAANAYIIEKDISLEARFDAIFLTKHGETYEIEHIENAFYPTVR